MSNFIESVVLDLINKKINWEKTSLILPGKRPVLFFKKSFKKHLKNSLLPKFLSIQEFMNEQSHLQEIDEISLWFYGYKAYTEIEKVPQSFEEFIKWFPTLLKDFNDIAFSLDDADNLFKYLVSAERIKKWGHGEIESMQTNQLMQSNLFFWEMAAKLYKKLWENLLKENKGFSGMLNRIAVENLNRTNANEAQIFVFVGFNALTKCEESVLKFYKNSGNALFYWDSDEYYLNHTEQEAGKFLRMHQNWNPDWNWTFSELKKPKNIQSIAVSKSVTQAKYASEILQKISAEDLENTALILADEAILPAVINSIPNNIQHLNISMGMPLKSVPMAHFFKALFDLQVNRLKFGKGLNYYYKDLLQIIDNQLFKMFLGEAELNVLMDIKQNNNLFFSVNDLVNHFKNSKFLKLFQLPKDAHDFIQNTIDWIDEVMQNGWIEGELEREHLFHFYRLFQKIDNHISVLNHKADYKTLQVLFSKIMQSDTISFLGEPLEGLQLMGLLETRLLDFDTIILTSVNEGVLPLGRRENSYIPYDIRLETGLNTYTENDAIYAYHFYRLMQRAKNIYWLYNTESEGLSSGEKSRFIQQFELESNQNIQEIVVSPSFQVKPNLPLKIEKTQFVQQKLDEWLENGISASSLSAFLYDEIEFYRQRILKIYDLDQTEETITAMTLGNIVHQTLEKLYQPYVNQILNKDIFIKIHKKVLEELQFAFTEQYKNGNYHSGHNLVVFEMAKEIVKSVLKKDQHLAENGQFIIKALEQNYSCDFKMSDGRIVKFKGIIDRIDEWNGEIRLIDYKTGSVIDSKLKVKEDKLEAVYSDKSYNKALQLFFYCFLYFSENPDDMISLYIHPLKQPNKTLIPLNYNESLIFDKGILETISPFLEDLIARIIQVDVPFMEEIQ